MLECIDLDIRLSDIPDSYLVNRIGAQSSTLKTRTQVSFIPYCDVNFGEASAARLESDSGPIRGPPR